MLVRFRFCPAKFVPFVSVCFGGVGKEVLAGRGQSLQHAFNRFWVFVGFFRFCLWMQKHEHMAQSAFANASGTLFTPHSGHAGRFVILSRVFVFCWLSTPISLSTSTWRSPHTSHQSLQDEWDNRIRLKHRQCPMVGGTTGTVFARYDALNPIVCNKTQNSPKGFVGEEMASQQKAGLGTLRTQPRQALKLPASAESDSLHKAKNRKNVCINVTKTIPFFWMVVLDERNFVSIWTYKRTRVDLVTDIFSVQICSSSTERFHLQLQCFYSSNSRFQRSLRCGK